MNVRQLIKPEFETIVTANSEATLLYGIHSEKNNYAILSFFNRSDQAVTSIGSSLTLGKGVAISGNQYCYNEFYDVYYQKRMVNKKRVTQALAINRKLKASRESNSFNSLFLATEETKEEVFYNYLMNNYDLPLLSEWKKPLFDELNGKLFSEAGEYDQIFWGLDEAHIAQLKLGSEYVAELKCYSCGQNEQLLMDTVSRLLRNKIIRISEKEMRPLDITDQNTYFQNYGKSVVSNLNSIVEAKAELDGETDTVFNTMTAFPQQIGIGNGAVAQLNETKSVIVEGEMGTGKTLIGLYITEKYFIEKARRKGQIKGIKDAYRNPYSINYRNIIMCPVHLVHKWRDTILREVPFAKVTIIANLEQLFELHRKGPIRKGREFYVVSKDTLKLGYQEMPSPKKIQTKQVKVKVCAKCGLPMTGHFCVACDDHPTEYKFDEEALETKRYLSGLICPHCNELLFKPGTDVMSFVSGKDNDVMPLGIFDFENPTDKNESCYYCGKRLWEPYIKNIDQSEMFYSAKEKKQKPWYRATFYRDKSKKGTKTIWIRRGHESSYSGYGERLSEYSDKEGGVRKYPPSVFIEKHLKGFFDLAIVDEVHTCKSGYSAQGASFQHIVNAAKKVICMTGTLSGGKTGDLFYLLYRLYPQMMKKELGYSWSDDTAFAEQFGVVEKQFEYTGNKYATTYNVNSRGRQQGRTAEKPGISPALFKYLIDKTVFLHMTDLSSHMQKLVEKVVISDMDRKPETRMLFRAYRECVDILKEASMKKDSGGIRGSKNVFEISYIDKPYEYEPIVHPVTGEVVLAPEDFGSLFDNGFLLPKEEDLINIVNSELSEGRNCVIYAEYTSEGPLNITNRLHELVKTNCGLSDNEVIILRSSSPAASNREDWMHEKAEQGMRVMICNPRLVETGLDFCWYNSEGVLRNYPTIIFYQIGSSLATVLQASRRSWRLNQVEECRNYYMGVKGTRQQGLIQLIAEKQSANGVIEGRFSTEGLAAMAQGVDDEMRLAQIMAEMDDTSVNKLQDMFDAINSSSDDDSKYGNYKKQLTYLQLMGDEAWSIKKTAASTITSFSSVDTLFNLNDLIYREDSSDEETSGVDSVIDITDFVVTDNIVEQPEVKQPSKDSNTKTISSITGGLKKAVMENWQTKLDIATTTSSTDKPKKDTSKKKVKKVRELTVSIFDFMEE